MSNLVETGEKFDLKIERSIASDAGDFTGGGWKMVWHTTESEIDSVDAIVKVLHNNGGAPHFVLGKKNGRWTAVQMIPLNQSAKTLRHPAGTPETNRANAIQVELCGRAANTQDWSLDHMQAIANLTRLINLERKESGHRMVPWEIGRSFANDDRFSGAEWREVEGHVGHKHAPYNTHWDPGRFQGALLIQLLKDMPDRGYYLLNG
jgi:hypothetical protein